MSERRRRTLTPLSGELRASDPWNERAPRRGGLARLRARRRRRPPPTTLVGAVVSGSIRFLLAVGIVGAIGVGGAALVERDASIGLYVAGAVLLAVAFFGSAADMETPFYDGYTREERERRVSLSFVYAAAGLCVVALGVLTEIL